MNRRLSFFLSLVLSSALLLSASGSLRACPLARYFDADTVKPHIVCPPSDTVDLYHPICSMVVQYTVQYSDDQANPLLIQLSGIPSGQPYPFGTTINQFLVTDQATNTATCSFYIHVRLADGVLGDSSNNDATLWKAPYFWDNDLQSNDLCEGAVDLRFDPENACNAGADSIRFELYMDWDQNGIFESVLDSRDLPGAGTLYLGNNDGDADLQDGELRSFDFRQVSTPDKWRFVLMDSLDPLSGKRVLGLRWNTANNPGNYALPELPYGKYEIKWYWTDGSGQEKNWKYDFEIKDIKPPKVVCLHGLSLNVLSLGVLTLYSSDFLQYTDDNCTAPGQIEIALRRAGEGTGFPLDVNGNPKTSITFNCINLGTHELEVWARDRAGNGSYCETTITVGDVANNCTEPPQPHLISGKIKTESGLPISNVRVDVLAELPGAANQGYDISQMGNYDLIFTSSPQDHYVKPSSNMNPLNGVSTYDLVQISKHILAFDTLDSPYKLIAADVNKSGSITTFDIVELRKLILGIYDSFPGNKSWRFVDKEFVFPHPENPFDSIFPESIPVERYYSVSNYWGFPADFIGIKIGDVNNSVVASLQSETEDRQAVPLIMENQYLEAGAVVEIPFHCAAPIEGCQFSLEHPGLQLLDIIPGTDVNGENFGIFEDFVTFSREKSGPFDFILRCLVQESGYTSEKIFLSSRKTKNEAYLAGNETRAEMALRFSGGPSFALFQNRPNPFEGQTELSFSIPEAMELSLSISDIHGRVLWEHKKVYAKGLNTESVPAYIFPESGVYCCVLKTNMGNFTQKMLKL